MNRLKILVTIAAALALPACGGAAEKAGSDRAAVAPSASPQSTTPVRAAATDATTAGASAAAPAPATAPGAAPPQGAPGAGGSRRPADPPPSREPAPRIGSGGNDFFLFTQARAAVNSDAELRASNLTLDVREGVVTLGGTVAHAALKSKAEQLVREAGSKTVRNQLRVSAGN